MSEPSIAIRRAAPTILVAGSMPSCRRADMLREAEIVIGGRPYAEYQYGWRDLRALALRERLASPDRA